MIPPERYIEAGLKRRKYQGHRNDKDPWGRLTEAARKHNKRIANEHWKLNNPLKAREAANSYYHRHKKSELFKQRKSEIRRRWYLKHRLRELEYAKTFRQLNPDKVKERMRKWRDKNKIRYTGNRCISCTSVLPENVLFCDWCTRNVKKEKLYALTRKTNSN